MSLMRARGSAILLCSLAVLCGCGDGGDAGSAVTGRVTYQGKALSSGSIGFYRPGGQPVMAALGADGGYSAQLPPGDYKVAIVVGFATTPDWKEGDPPPQQVMRLPPQYTNRSRSVLTASVAEGQSAPIDFDLK